jgi:putative peptidoglycan lipid II flippase
MVKKVIALMKKEIGGLHEAAYLLAFFTFLSQVLAVVRDRILAGTFGAGPVLDVYYASFKIPDTVFVSLASLVSASIIIPFIIEKEKESKEALKKFLNSIFSSFSVLLIVSSFIIFCFTPQILRLLFPDFFVDFRGQEAVFFTRIMLIQPILLGLSNFISGAVQSRGRFFAYALSPLFYNFGIIAGVVFLYPVLGNVGLAWGVVLGALLHLLIQLPAVHSIQLIPHFSKDIDFKNILKVFRLSLPRTVALAANNLSTLVLISMASSLGLGAIAIFTFGWNLQSVPLAIVGASYSMAAFPTLARLFSEKNEEKFVEILRSSVNHIIFWSMPFLSLFIVLRAQIVRVILGSGKFDWEDTRLTAATLAIFPKID